VALTLLGCRAADRLDQSKAVRDAVQAALDEITAAMRRGDVAAALAWYAPFAVQLRRNRSDLVGLDAFERNIAAWVQENEIVDGRFQVDAVDVSGDLAVSRGTWDFRTRRRAAPADSVTPGRGKFLTLWKRAGDGHYRILWDLGVSSDSVPALLAP
jgi:ketosteroid isomerase-like protein